MCELHTLDHPTASPSGDGAKQAPGGGPVGRRAIVLGAATAALGLGLVGGTALPASAATSQNGWSVKPALTKINAGGNSNMFPPGARRGEVHTILQWVARQYHQRVEKLVSGWCWGYSYRPIRGGSSFSNHASGTAIDCNAPRHPIGKSGTFSGKQRAEINAIVKYCNGVVRWGGSYSGRKDEMHFEINVRPGDKRIRALARKIGGGSTPPPPEDPKDPPKKSGWPTLKRGSTGGKVVELQHLLNARGRRVATDGDFGSKTAAAVKSFQGSRSLASDAVVGAKTWPKLVVSTKKNSKGAAVRGVQHALKRHGYKLSVDGIFGTITRSKVIAIQGKKGLVRDGIAGPKTWRKLV
ncbi:MAG: peptidoglycan-binding protein [Propionibacteriaceae bacterium]